MLYRTLFFLLSIAAPAAFAQNMPYIWGLSPASGNSTPTQPVNFSLTASDADGASDIAIVDILFGNCKVHYDSGSFYLFDVTNPYYPVVQGPFTPGSPISTNLCTLSAASAVDNGYLNVSVTLTFSAATAGSWQILATVEDYEGLGGAWFYYGPWTVGPGPQPPTIVSTTLSPRGQPALQRRGNQVRPRALAGADLGSVIVGQPLLMSVGVVDPTGAGNIQSIEAGTASCMPSYQNGFLWLNGVSGSIGLGSNLILTNPYCSVTQPTLVTSGTQATLVVPVTFNGTSNGNQAVSAYAANAAGLTTGWVGQGTATVALPTTAPAIVGMPGALVTDVGSSQLQTYSFYDPNGANNISMAQGGSPDCMATYQNGSISLNNASGSLAPGSTGSLSNGYCTLSNPTISTSGTQMTMSHLIGPGMAAKGTTELLGSSVQDGSGLLISWTPVGSSTTPDPALQPMQFTISAPPTVTINRPTIGQSGDLGIDVTVTPTSCVNLICSVEVASQLNGSQAVGISQSASVTVSATRLNVPITAHLSHTVTGGSWASDPGPYTLSITATGSPGGNQRLATVQASVNAPLPDFTIDSLQGPSPASISPGGSATFTLKVTGQSGFYAVVGFQCSSGDLPPGGICSFSPASVNLGSAQQTIYLTVSTAASTPIRPAGYTFTITAAGGGKSHKIAAVLPIGTTSNPLQIVSSNPNGLQLTVDSATCISPCNFYWASGTSHTISAASQSNSSAQYTFVSWSDGGAATHSVTVPASNAVYTANFGSQYYLTTSVSPAGAGSVSPPSGWYNSGTTVNVSATAGKDYQFAGFTGNLGTSTNPQFLTINGPKSVRATFAPVRTSLLLFCPMNSTDPNCPSPPLPIVPPGAGEVQATYTFSAGNPNLLENCNATSSSVTSRIVSRTLRTATLGFTAAIEAPPGEVGVDCTWNCDGADCTIDPPPVNILPAPVITSVAKVGPFYAGTASTIRIYGKNFGTAATNLWFCPSGANPCALPDPVEFPFADGEYLLHFNTWTDNFIEATVTLPRSYSYFYLWDLMVAAAGAWVGNSRGQFQLDGSYSPTLQYWSDTGWVDATTGTIYVPTGTKVDFRANTPGSIPVWSGSSGVSGTGPTNSATFGVRSASTGDFKTVIVNGTLRANIVVFDFDGVLTPDDNFAGRSLTDFGVGEIIHLSFTTTPAISAEQAGGLVWTVEQGGGKLTDNGDGTGEYDVPDLAGPFSLALRPQKGPAKKQPSGEQKKEGNIVPPNGARQIQKPNTNVMHTQGIFSIGHAGHVYLSPDNVSFKNLVFREGGGVLSSTGYLGDPNGQQHTPGPWLAIASCTKDVGCRVATTDKVEIIGDAGPFGSGGTYDWPIDLEYKIADAADETRKKFTSMTHHATADAQGTATSQKGGAGPFTKRLNDPTSAYCPQGFPCN